MPFLFLDRSRKWVQNTRRADLIGASTEYLYDNVKICSAHFESSHYYGGGSTRLRRDAVPTKFDIPNPPKPVKARRPLVRRQEDANVQPRTGKKAPLSPPCSNWWLIEFEVFKHPLCDVAQAPCLKLLNAQLYLQLLDVIISSVKFSRFG